MPAHKNITSSDFDQIKKLTDMNFKNHQITKILGWGDNTIIAIKKCKDFKDYEEYKKQWAIKYNRKPKVDVLPEPKIVKSFDEHNTVVTLLKSIEYNQQVMITILKDGIKVKMF